MDIDKLIYDIAIENGFSKKTSELIVAQAKIESAHYTSESCRDNNNLFGIKYVGQPLAQKGTLAPLTQRSKADKITNYYARYATLEDSVRDVVERLYNKTINGVEAEQLKNADTHQEFARLLKVRQFYDGLENDYANAIKTKLQNMGNEKSPDEKKVTNRDIIEVIVFFVVLYAVYYYLKHYGYLNA